MSAQLNTPGFGRENVAPRPRPSCEVTGTVRDERGGVVPAADVDLGGRRTVTNAEGLFRYPNVPTGTRGLRVKAAGFREWARNLSIGPIVTALTVAVVLEPERRR